MNLVLRSISAPQIEHHGSLTRLKKCNECYGLVALGVSRLSRVESHTSIIRDGVVRVIWFEGSCSSDEFVVPVNIAASGSSGCGRMPSLRHPFAFEGPVRPSRNCVAGPVGASGVVTESMRDSAECSSLLRVLRKSNSSECVFDRATLIGLSRLRGGSSGWRIDGATEEDVLVTVGNPEITLDRSTLSRYWPGLSGVRSLIFGDETRYSGMDVSVERKRDLCTFLIQFELSGSFASLFARSTQFGIWRRIRVEAN
jgi:hypothetical protein